MSTYIIAIALTIVVMYDYHMLTTRRDQITFKRNGGLRFWRFGRLGGSLYITRKPWKAWVKTVGGLHFWQVKSLGGSVYISASVTHANKARIAFALNMI